MNREVREVLTEARAYVRREATSPTINLLEPKRAREGKALLRRIDVALSRPKHRTMKEQP